MRNSPVGLGSILVVEDERAIAETLLYALRSEGFRAEHVDLGSEALLRHETAPFDLVVLDVGLPDMSGFDVLRSLHGRIRPGEVAVPVLFLTARGEEIDRVLGLELGADDYVVKPFSPREVAARVRAILRRGTLRPQRPEVPTDPWHRQPESHRIVYHGTLLDLTRYEYRLLDLLVSHPGRVFGRDQIMAMVWGDALDTSDRTIDAHIKTLRAKLRAVCPDADPIRTYRGIGYALES
ncbi:MAG: two-component system response regulator CreB [Rhodocyclales bacterium]|nr:two-component system response regulator CreB [Rhodocyclales bacterium]MBI5786907.1 two-component system response regulator CreB [Rhodocyclales bacterium]